MPVKPDYPILTLIIPTLDEPPCYSGRQVVKTTTIFVQSSGQIGLLSENSARLARFADPQNLTDLITTSNTGA